MLDKLTRTVRLHPSDNVIVCVDLIGAGVTVEHVTATERIMRGHKMATVPIAKGKPVTKFGQIIGFASQDIAAGTHVHEHNCTMGEFERDYAIAQGNSWTPPTLDGLPLTFDGYRRPDGKSGTRNYIAILSSVNCSASVSHFVAKAINDSGILADYPNIDGIAAFTHGTGCGMASDGEGYQLLQRSIWGHAANPNIGAAVMIGLGCEVFQIPRLMETYGLKHNNRFRTMTIQGTGGTRKTVERAVDNIKEMLPSRMSII